MFLFYLKEIKDDLNFLNAEESRHCVKVLRLKEGDHVNITDGRGYIYKSEITDANTQRCAVKIVEKEKVFDKRPYYLHMAVAPTKNISRFEWFIEKAVEIGVDEVTPVICENSERKTVKTERLEKIAVAAMKQSLKAYMPIINEAEEFNGFIRKDIAVQKFIGYIDDTENAHLKDHVEPDKNVTILIGPEGDFSRDELNRAKETNFVPISLGKSRLRVETAAIAACYIVNLINNG